MDFIPAEWAIGGAVIVAASLMLYALWNRRRGEAEGDDDVDRS